MLKRCWPLGERFNGGGLTTEDAESTEKRIGIKNAKWQMKDAK